MYIFTTSIIQLCLTLLTTSQPVRKKSTTPKILIMQVVKTPSQVPKRTGSQTKSCTFHQGWALLREPYTNQCHSYLIKPPIHISSSAQVRTLGLNLWVFNYFYGKTYWLPAHLHGITLELEDSCSLLGKITVAGSEESTDFVYSTEAFQMNIAKTNFNNICQVGDGHVAWIQQNKPSVNKWHINKTHTSTWPTFEYFKIKGKHTYWSSRGYVV